MDGHLLEDSCARLLGLAKQHHPGCQLGIWVLGFEDWRGGLDVEMAGRTDDALLDLQLDHAGRLQWKQVRAWAAAPPCCLGGRLQSSVPSAASMQ